MSVKPLQSCLAVEATEQMKLNAVMQSRVVFFLVPLFYHSCFSYSAETMIAMVKLEKVKLVLRGL